jgi:hypothetical protein
MSFDGGFTDWAPTKDNVRRTKSAADAGYFIVVFPFLYNPE